MTLVYGWDSQVAKWVQAKLNEDMPFKEFTAIGVLHENELIAGVVYSRFMGHDILMNIASISPKWATRANLSAFFAYPFDQLGCARVSAITARKNKQAREMLIRLGFVLEGKLRRGHDGKQDAMVYGMLKEECKWRV